VRLEKREEKGCRWRRETVGQCRKWCGPAILCTQMYVGTWRRGGRNEGVRVRKGRSWRKKTEERAIIV